MATLLEFHTAGGGKILVESALDDDLFGQIEAAAAGPRVALHTLEESLQSLVPLVDASLGQLAALASKPDAIELEFGIKLGSEAGIVLAKAALEAQITIKVSWKNGNGDVS